jgi:integrase/recombinase XerC
MERRADTMKELAVMGSNALAMKQELNGDMFKRWTSYIDASPRTIEAYSKNIKRFIIYLQNNGIHRPQREDIVEYRDYLKVDHKPTTVQSYLAAVKLFFQWTEREGIYPNVADRVKGAKLDTEHKKDYLTSKQVGKLLGAIDRTTTKGKRDMQFSP